MGILEFNVLIAGIYFILFGLLVKSDGQLITTIFANIMPIICGINCILYILTITGIIKV